MPALNAVISRSFAMEHAKNATAAAPRQAVAKTAHSLEHVYITAILLNLGDLLLYSSSDEGVFV